LLDGLYTGSFSAMFSKPMAFVLLALGCLTAAAGGAYVATRHNLSDEAARVSAPAALASPASSQPAAAPSKAVAETEAAVSRPAPEVAPPPAPAPARPAPVAHAEAPAPAETSRHVSEPAHRVESRPAMAPPAGTTASRQAPRTVPMTNPGTPVNPPEPSNAPQAGAPVPMPAPARPAESIKPVEEPQPEPARTPQYDELILPAASVIGLQVETNLSTERAHVEDRVDARVSRDVMAAGRVAIPAGSRVIGSVTTVERGGKMKEQARLGIRFHTLVLADGTQLPLHTDPVYRLGEDPTAGATKKIGGAAIGGAIIGAILGGGKGAAIGGATGAAGGTAVAMAGDRNPATLRQGEYLNVKLSTPATITVERHEQ
jgi:hypothetical protein